MRFQSFKKKPDIKQRFTSGNQIEVFIREVEPKMFDAACEWDIFPPSDKDIAEYQKSVVPRLASVMARKNAEKN
jgi:hypothetical protein